VSIELSQVRECVGVFGKVFGHRTEARYSVREQEMSWPDELYKSTALLAFGRDIFVRSERVYEGEVCTRCGSTFAPEE
jgi:hypothetical protein